MQSQETICTMKYTHNNNNNSLIITEDEEIPDMATRIAIVERILNYKFNNSSLLEEALTHASCTDSVSYQRLEFVGDVALGLAISTVFFLAYPELDPGLLSVLRAANVNTEKLARVAVRHRLYKYVRHYDTSLDEKVKEFVIALQQEEQAEFYGGAIKAPKVLADIVESVAAAVYMDCGFDLKCIWVILRGLLEPIITMDVLEQQPVTMLFECCQKDGKKADIKYQRIEENTIASVYVDEKFIVSASSDNKEIAKLHAAKAALQKLAYKTTGNVDVEVDPNSEIEGAKQKLNELCGRKRWPKPIYRIEKELGPPHDRSFICSVQVAVAEGLPFAMGEERPRVKDAENSAASKMIRGLQEAKNPTTVSRDILSILW